MDKNRTGLALAMLAMLAALAAMGCGPKVIPNTEIEDNDENREIVAFCERYRRAVEDLNVGLLLSMASPRYFDNSGTPTGDDDMDRAGLEDVLKNRFKSVRSMRYEVRYRSIKLSFDVIQVDYTFTMSFQYDVDGKSKWANKTSDNRLELERVDGGFLILSGM